MSDAKTCTACGDALPAGAYRVTLQRAADEPQELLACTPEHLADLLLALASSLLSGAPA